MAVGDNRVGGGSGGNESNFIVICPASGEVAKMASLGTLGT